MVKNFFKFFIFGYFYIHEHTYKYTQIYTYTHTYIYPFIFIKVLLHLHEKYNYFFPMYIPINTINGHLHLKPHVNSELVPYNEFQSQIFHHIYFTIHTY